MKVLLKNSELIFKKSTIVEKSFTKIFTSADIGTSANFFLTLDSTIKPNVPFSVLVSGDSGVVSGDLWNLKFGYPGGGDCQAYGNITTGTSRDITINAEIGKIGLNRGSIAGAGSVTIKVTYAEIDEYTPTAEITEAVDINNDTLSAILNLGYNVASPCGIPIKIEGGTPGAFTFDVFLMDVEDNDLSTFYCSNHGEFNTAINSTNTPVSKVRIARRTGSSASGTFNVTIIVP